MFKHFLTLEWKQYFRSSYWQKNLALNIVMIFLALYFMAVFLILGFALLPALKKLAPDQDPFVLVNTYFFYWVIADLLMRFFFQKLPVISVKPLLTLPIKRSVVVNFVLIKSALSFFNVLPLFVVVPFSIMAIIDGMAISIILTWLTAVVLITLLINFVNFIIEAFSSDLNLSFLPIMVVSGTLIGLNYFGIVDFGALLSQVMLAIAHHPISIAIILALLIGVYIYNYNLLKAKLFLDASLQSRGKDVKTSDMAWTRRLGDIAPFMQLDLKLIWRNKRTKSMAFLMVIGLLYGLVFYPQPTYRDMEFMWAFIGIFSTGFFLINFGQFIPAWDSGYYKMLMSQNIKYEQYLRSKFILMVASVGLMFVLGIPYVYFGWKILLAHFAAAIYNIGVNSHVILWGGSFNRKKIDLDKKAAFNYQGTGAVQWLIGIPLMVVPMALFGIINWVIGFELAILTLVVLGVIGIVFHQKLMALITEKYLDSKYKMIYAFSQDT